MPHGGTCAGPKVTIESFNPPWVQAAMYEFLDMTADGVKKTEEPDDEELAE